MFNYTQCFYSFYSQLFVYSILRHKFYKSALSYIKYMHIHEQLYNKILLHVPAVSRALVKKQNIFYKMILWSLHVLDFS